MIVYILKKIKWCVQSIIKGHNFAKSLKLMKYSQSYSMKDNEIPYTYQQRAKYFCYKYNKISPLNKIYKRIMLNNLLNCRNSRVVINSPFTCDYGFNIHFKGYAFINYGNVILDDSPIWIGKGVNIGPNSVIACSGHPNDWHKRSKGLLLSKSIFIGDYSWIGANVFIKGGVTIGSHSVIGAGSVVTRNIPNNVIAFGVPCKVYKHL